MASGQSRDFKRGIIGVRKFGSNLSIKHSGIIKHNDLANNVSTKNCVVNWSRLDSDKTSGIWKFHRNLVSLKDSTGNYIGDTTDDEPLNSVIFQKNILIEISRNRIEPNRFYIKNELYPIYNNSGNYGPDDIFKIKLINISQDIGETKIMDIKCDSNNNLIILGNKEVKYNTHNKPKTQINSFLLKYENTSNNITKYNLSSYDTVNNTEMKIINNYSSGLEIGTSNELYVSGIKQQFTNNFKKYFLFNGGVDSSLDSKLVNIKDIDNVFEYAYNNGWNFVSIEDDYFVEDYSGVLLNNYDNYKNVQINDYVYIYRFDKTLISKFKIDNIIEPTSEGGTRYLLVNTDNGSSYYTFGFSPTGVFWYKNLDKAFEMSVDGLAIHGNFNDNISMFGTDVYGANSTVQGASWYAYNYSYHDLINEWDSTNYQDLIPGSGGTHWFAPPTN